MSSSGQWTAPRRSTASDPTTHRPSTKCTASCKLIMVHTWLGTTDRRSPTCSPVRPPSRARITPCSSDSDATTRSERLRRCPNDPATGQCFAAGVHHRPIGRGHAHHSGPHPSPSSGPGPHRGRVVVNIRPWSKFRSGRQKLKASRRHGPLPCDTTCGAHPRASRSWDHWASCRFSATTAARRSSSERRHVMCPPKHVIP